MALRYATTAAHIPDRPPRPRCAVDDEQQRPVRRQTARHQVAEQAAGDGRRLGGPFPQSQHVLAALCVDSQCHHHVVAPEALAVDADHPQVQLAQRPPEKRPPALGRRRHEPPRHRATRRSPLRHPVRQRVQRARIPPRRHARRDRCQRALVQRIGGRRPLEARQRQLAVGVPHARRGTATWRLPSVTSLATLLPGHAGPLGSMAPLRSARISSFPSIMACRTCNAVWMRKPWNACRTPFSTPNTGSGTWIETVRELAVGWNASAWHASP